MLLGMAKNTQEKTVKLNITASGLWKEAKAFHGNKKPIKKRKNDEKTNDEKRYGLQEKYGV
jgi:hypothetical protein